MNIENIKALAEIISSYGLTSIKYSDDAVNIQLEKNATAFPTGAQACGAVYETPSQPYGRGLVAGGNPGQADGSLTEVSLTEDPDLTEVTSPFVGVFYSAPSPDSQPFVSIGAKVGKGDILCVIETMKLMNEIVAEQDGEIIDICVKNGDIVEYGQALCKCRGERSVK